jgi:multidrug efflux pump subunit AcrA (membrane-fusion protein)
MQVMQLQAQLVLMTQRTEAAEAATAAAAIQLSTAQQAAAAAKSAQHAAEEAYKAMEARSRLVDQRLAGDGPGLLTCAWWTLDASWSMPAASLMHKNCHVRTASSLGSLLLQAYG